MSLHASILNRSPSVTSVAPRTASSRILRPLRVCRPRASQKEDKPIAPTAELGAGLKAVWYGAETFGNFVGAQKKQQGGDVEDSGNSDATSVAAQITRAEAMKLLKEDYDENYFVSGKGSMDAYDEDCTFADPFVSFKGVGRFKTNVSNFSGLLEDVNLKISGWEEGEDSLLTNWRFSCILQLPWKPKIAAAGSTTHVFDKNTGKVVEHIEAWNTEPSKVVGQLLKPGSDFPTSKAEVIMMAVSEGDVKGVWFELSPLVFKLALPWTVLALVAQGVTGSDLPGTLEGIKTTAEVLLALSAFTEVIKLVGQLGL